MKPWDVGPHALVLMSAFLISKNISKPQQPERRYWPVSLDSLATGKVPHTHVQTVGRVKLVRHEADGDWHVQLTGVRAFIVLELIPGLSVPRPVVGQRIRAFGITRVDHEHGDWVELHPCERWEPVP